MTKLTVGSAFTGIGGIDLAFALADFDILWQIEIDDYCQKVLAKHHEQFFPNAKLFTDIRTVTAEELAYVDVIVGGFPCQNISVAGKGAGIQHGNRSGLWFELERLIRDIRPRAVLLENVARITSARKEEDGSPRPADMAVVVNALSQLGYDSQWGIISAADTGAPHLRERWFCLAHRRPVGDSTRKRTSTTEQPEQWHGSEQNGQNMVNSDSIRPRQSATARLGKYSCDKFGHTQTRHRAQIPHPLISGSPILRRKNRLAHAHRQRCHQIRKHRL